jgi:Fanconi-associated nuclease 1
MLKSDLLLPLGSRPKLLKRLRRLEKTLCLPAEEYYISDFGLREATLRTIEGVRIFKPALPTHQGVSNVKGTNLDKSVDHQGSIGLTMTDPKPQPAQKGKTIWAGKEGEVNVETFALEYYATHGFKG